MPHEWPQRITIRLSRWTVALLGVTAVALAFGTTLGSWTLVRGLLAFDDVEQLREQNQALLVAKEELESRLWDLQGQLADYEQRTQQLAVVAGVELQLDELAQGLGGEAPRLLSPAAHVDQLSRRSSRLSSMLDDVETRLTGTPSIVPAWGELTSNYGYRRDPLTGERSFHRGIDIGTDPERAVYASATGTVSLARRKGALGNAVHLSHGFGLTTRYGHLARIVVEKGQQIEQGEIVGYVGRTGRATGYHLHFEVLLDGRPVDPMQYLKSDLAGP